MKKSILYFAIAIILLFTKINGFGQYDTSYQSTYYQQKVTQFRLIKDAITGEIIFIGDSITDIGEWAELWGNNKVLNRGISADNTFGILNRLDEITSRKPAKIFIMIGINDISKSIPDSVIIKNYYTIINRIKKESSNTKIYIQSILPTNNSFPQFVRHQNKTEHIIVINNALQKLALQKNCVYVDVYSALLDKENKLDNLYTNDGLHINGKGYFTWKNLLFTKGYCCN